MTDIDALIEKVTAALNDARQRVLARESLAAALVLSRGSIEDHVALDPQPDDATGIVTVRCHATTAHGFAIARELEACKLDFAWP